MPGSIRHRGGDSWQVRVSLGRDPDTGHYRYASRYVHDTESWHDTYYHAHCAEEPDNSRRITIHRA